LDLTGCVGQFAGSWNILHSDADASELSAVTPEREVQAPLDVRAEGAFQVRTFDANIYVHLRALLFLFSILCTPSAYFGQLEYLLDRIRIYRSMLVEWNG
jgi:hypothetical protein